MGKGEIGWETSAKLEAPFCTAEGPRDILSFYVTAELLDSQQTQGQEQQYGGRKEGGHLKRKRIRRNALGPSCTSSAAFQQLNLRHMDLSFVSAFPGSVPPGAPRAAPGGAAVKEMLRPPGLFLPRYVMLALRSVSTRLTLVPALPLPLLSSFLMQTFTSSNTEGHGAKAPLSPAPAAGPSFSHRDFRAALLCTVWSQVHGQLLSWNLQHLLSKRSAQCFLIGVNETLTAWKKRSI